MAADPAPVGGLTGRRDLPRSLLAWAGQLSSISASTGNASGSSVEDLRAHSASLRRLEGQLGPARLRASVGRHLDAVLALSGGAGRSGRRDLQRVASETSELAGWLAFDSGRMADAEVRYRLALALAHEADDPTLAAWAMGNLGRALTTIGRGDEAAGLLEAAGRLATGMGAMRLASWLAATAAWDHAVGGRRRESVRELGNAERLLAHPDQTEYDWLSFYGYSQLDKWAGRCQLLFGQSASAARSFRTSLRLLSPLLVREQAATLTDLADAYARQGEVDSACSSLLRAFTIARHAGSRRIEAHIGAVRASLDGWASSACVRDLDEVMASQRVG
jgi:hypothetical protein